MKTLQLTKLHYSSPRLLSSLRHTVFTSPHIHHLRHRSVPWLRSSAQESVTEGSKIEFDQDGLRLKERVGQGQVCRLLKVMMEMVRFQVLFQFPSELAISGSDAESDPQLSPLVEGKGELLKLTLWLMNERSKGDQSNWYSFLKTLPEHSMSPILWKDEELESLLKGSPVLEQARQRRKALKQEWNSLLEKWTGQVSTFDLSSLLNTDLVLVSLFCREIFRRGIFVCI